MSAAAAGGRCRSTSRHCGCAWRSGRCSPGMSMRANWCCAGRICTCPGRWTGRRCAVRRAGLARGVLGADRERAGCTIGRGRLHRHRRDPGHRRWTPARCPHAGTGASSAAGAGAFTARLTAAGRRRRGGAGPDAGRAGQGRPASGRASPGSWRRTAASPGGVASRGPDLSLLLPAPPVPFRADGRLTVGRRAGGGRRSGAGDRRVAGARGGGAASGAGAAAGHRVGGQPARSRRLAAGAAARRRGAGVGVAHRDRPLGRGGAAGWRHAARAARRVRSGRGWRDGARGAGDPARRGAAAAGGAHPPRRPPGEPSGALRRRSASRHRRCAPPWPGPRPPA